MTSLSGHTGFTQSSGKLRSQTTLKLLYSMVVVSGFAPRYPLGFAPSLALFPSLCSHKTPPPHTHTHTPAPMFLFLCGCTGPDGMGGAFAAYERLGDKAEYIGIGHGGSKRYVMKNAPAALLRC